MIFELIIRSSVLVDLLTVLITAFLYSVDATAETGYLGRLVNHSAKEPNLVTRIMEVKNLPHLILVAARDIAVGEELLYDYGDRSRDAVEANPWLKTT